MQHDLVVRNGHVLDGAGGPGVDADVAIDGDRIAAVGPALPAGRAEIDARGQLVTPGFVDIHTHYDGQATWDEQLQPSAWHGVTTVVMGNCGVGFAPCRPPDRERLIGLMEGVEDIPGTALAEGLPWTWETFPEYLDAVDAVPHDVDIAAMLPHGPLRVWAMGDRGVAREEATPDDIAVMARAAEAATRAGALGFSTSRTMLHRAADGSATPMLHAAERELVGIARGVAAGGGGVFEMVSDFLDPADEFGVLRAVAREAGFGGSFSLLETVMNPGNCEVLLGLVDAALAAGETIRAQVLSRPIGVLLGLSATLHPLQGRPSFAALEGLPLREQVAALRRDEVRARLLAEQPSRPHPFLAAFGQRWERFFVLGETPNYEPPPEASIAAMAEARGEPPLLVAVDAMLEDEGRGLLFFPFANYNAFNLESVRKMMSHPATVFGLGDAGAHVGIICDGSAPTSTLCLWGRDRPTGRFPLPWLIHWLTRRPAEAVGLHDRGLLHPGMKADVNIIDFDALTPGPVRVHRDLPAGGKRLLQRPTGYKATIVSGRCTYREGEPSGARPGRLIRGRQESIP